MQLSYPSSVNVGQGFYLTVSIFNSGSTTFSGASVNIGSMTVSFTIENATACSQQCQSVTWSGGVINVGNLAPGSTVLTVGLKAPGSPTQFSGQATLSYVGESQPITLPISIRVSGRP
ncbi:MAG TPA: hypothetical protein VFE91_05720 [Nitrososphaerales archaeon]|nr:hypothetical protein [Nitrososphaerales archaeon]